MPEGDGLKAGESLDSWLARTAPAQTADPSSSGIKPGEDLQSWLGRTKPAGDGGLTNSFNQGAIIPPDRAARILKLQMETGYAPDFVDRNLDGVEAQSKKYGTDLKKLLAYTPLTAQYLTENPKRVGLFLQDLPHLQRIETGMGQVQSPLLKRRPDELLMKQAQETAAQQFAAQGTYQGDPISDAGGPAPSTKEDLVDREFQRLKSVEDFVSGTQPLGFGGVLSHRLGENPVEPIPFAGSIGSATKGANLYMAAKKYEAGTATKEDVQNLEEAARIQLAEQSRGTDWTGKIASTGLGILPFAGEVAATGGAAGFGKKLVLGGAEEAAATVVRRVLARVAGAAMQTIPAGITAIPSAAIQRATPKSNLSLDENGNFKIEQTPGESPAEAMAKATFSRFADQVAAELVGMKFAGGQATEAAVKQSIAKEGLKEVGKFMGMGELSSAIKSVPFGKARIQDWQVPLVIKAMSGDKEAQGELLAQSVVGFGMGASGAAMNNLEVKRADASRAVDHATAAQDTLAQAAESVKAMQADKSAPEVVQQAVEKLTKDSQPYTYVSPEEFSKYYEQKGVDPRAFATDLTGNATALDDALADGHPLQIPTDQYLTKVAKEDGAFFQDKVTLDPSAPSVNAAQQHLTEIDAQMEAERQTKKDEAAQKKAQAEAEQADAQAATVGEKIAQSAEQAGRPKQEASALGKIVESVYKMFGMRGKTTPEELAAKYGPQIQKATDAQAGSLEQPGKRGAYTPRDITGDKAVISAFESGDSSTVVHELGHQFLDILHELSLKPDADPSLKADFQKFLEWQGVKDPEAWSKMSLDEKRPHHEAWANAYEQWLWEGKAPNKALRGVFFKFREWLSKVYDSLVGKGIVIPDSIRGVFERLHASDAEIQVARERMDHLEPFLTGLKDAPMSPADTEKLAQLREDATRAATERLDKESLSDLKYQQSEQGKHARDILEKDVTAEFDQTKEAKALAYFKGWTKPDGSPLDEGTPLFKLSSEAIKEEIPGLDLRSFPREMLDSTYKEDNGITPAAAADMFGFSDAKELLNALINTDRAEFIRRETDARFAQQVVDPSPTLPEEARQAIHNDAQAKLDVYEMNWLVKNKLPQLVALSKKFSNPEKYIENLRTYAEGKVTRESFRSLDPGIYERGEMDARKAARDALLAGDIKGAVAFKERAALNHEIFRAAADGKAEAQKAADYMKKFQDLDTRAMLGKAGNDYLDVIDGISERFEFTNATGSKLESRKILADFIIDKAKSGEDLGEHLSAPSFMTNEAFRVNWKDLKLSDLRQMRDTAKQIETMARATNKMNSIEGKITFDEARQELISQLKKTQEALPPESSRTAKGIGERIGKVVRSTDAAMVKMEQLIKELDGGNIDGPWHKFLMFGASDAQGRELDLWKETRARMMEGIKALPKETRAKLDEVIALPGRRKITRWDTLGFALQAGNEQNWSKFNRGEEMRPGGFKPDEINKFMNDLTKPEKDYVQHVWDTLESLWPQISSLYKKLTGLPPEKVEARPQHSAFIGYRGGYAPIIYDSRNSRQGEAQESSMIGEMTTAGYRSATTANGFSKKRTDFAAPMDTDIQNLNGHLASVIKDLTHREWMLDANKILNDPEISSALKEYVGPEYYSRMREWLKQVVNDRNATSLGSLGTFKRLLNAARLNMAIVATGFKAGTLLHHLTSIESALGDLGPTYMAKGAAKMRAPFDAYKEMVNESPEMRHFWEDHDRDIKDIYERTAGKTDLISLSQRGASNAIGLMNMIRAIPTYFGGKAKAMDTLPEKYTGAEREALAIRAGEEAVRLNIGAGAAKDRAAIMSPGSEFMKVFTTFFTPGSILYNRMHDIKAEAGRTKDVGRAVSRVFWTVIAAALSQKLVTGHTPDEQKGETWSGWAAENEAMYPLSSMPMVKELAETLIKGKEPASTNPIVRDAQQLLHARSAIGKAVKGEISHLRAAEETARSANMFLGLPVDQLFITGDYLHDLGTGDQSPNDLWELWHNILHYHRKR